jgi:kinesin family protein 2/24
MTLSDASVNRNGNQPTYCQCTRQHARPTNIIPALNGHGKQQNLATARGMKNIAPKPRRSMEVSFAASQQQLQQQTGMAPRRNKGRLRDSSVVNVVERMKKNREERRQRQAERKKENEILKSMDLENPNREFQAMITEYRNGIEFRPLRETDPVKGHRVTVCIRKRPLSKQEMSRKEVDVISVPNKDQIIVHEQKLKVNLTKYLQNQHFKFDYAFNETCSNEVVYKYTAKPLVQTIFEGGMATCFAYGQTGSGKTHTMGGNFKGKNQDFKKGIYAMAAKDVFEFLKSPKYKFLNLTVSVSFFEIYNGKVLDLLANKAELRVLEDGKQQVHVDGLTEKRADSEDEVLNRIQQGGTARTAGRTSANSNSSRSHAVLQIVVRTPGTNRIHGKFSLIDLAGNETVKDTSYESRQTRVEGAVINKSLLALRECIRALGRKGARVPFRTSKLTQVLRDSFIGEKSRTCMIAMISPGMESCEHTLHTLRFADRVKELAANDPMETNTSPSSEEEPMDVEDNGSLEDSDLSQLESLNEGETSAEQFTFHETTLNEGETSAEQFTFHETISELQLLKEWTELDQVLAMTNDVGDQREYSKQLELVLAERIGVLNDFKQKVAAFGAQLAEK